MIESGEATGEWMVTMIVWSGEIPQLRSVAGGDPGEIPTARPAAGDHGAAADSAARLVVVKVMIDADCGVE